MSVPFWTEDPAILLNQKFIGELWCGEGMSTNQKLNAISRLVIVMSIGGWVLMQSSRFLITGILTLGALVALHYYFHATRDKLTLEKTHQEGFANLDVMDQLDNAYTEPVPENPLMNVPVPDFGTNKRQKAAAPSFNPVVEKDINASVQRQVVDMNPGIDHVEDRLFRDLGDNFVFSQSMRNFYSMPNTNVPNNQGEFADFCYGSMPSCKERNPVACAKHGIRHINR